MFTQACQIYAFKCITSSQQDTLTRSVIFLDLFSETQPEPSQIEMVIVFVYLQGKFLLRWVYMQFHLAQSIRTISQKESPPPMLDFCRKRRKCGSY
ncbi:MAG TPA: hypothetical protein DCR93_38370 [Cytophagales bacterium]|nr:hypothetical protein [Cytophagales bacterium]